jgi:hypothetical protein
MSNEPCNRQRQKRTVDSQAAFLCAFRDTCSVTASAIAAGISRKQHYQWLRSDADYMASFERSKVAAHDYLKNLNLEPVICGAVRQCDGKLLMRLLRRTMPEKFGVPR